MTHLIARFIGIEILLIVAALERDLDFVRVSLESVGMIYFLPTSSITSFQILFLFRLFRLF